MENAREDPSTSSEFYDETRPCTLRCEVIGIFHRDIVKSADNKNEAMVPLSVEDVVVCAEASDPLTEWGTCDEGR